MYLRHRYYVHFDEIMQDKIPADIVVSYSGPISTEPNMKTLNVKFD